MLNLDQMELTQLQTLQKQLDAMARAGRTLIDAGLTPSFAVSAWVPAITVPPLGADVSALSTRAETQTATVGAMFLSPRRADLVKDGPRERPAKPATAEGGFAPFTPEAAPPDAVTAVPGQEEPAPPQDGSEAPRLAAGDEPAASETVMPLRAPAYTEEDTAWAIMTFLDLTEGGMLQEAAVSTIALKLGRTPDGIKSRFYGPWKRRLQEERDRRAAERAKPISVSPAFKPTPAPEAIPEAPPEPPRSIYEDPLVQRISALKLPPQWDYGADQRMLRLAVAGLDPQTIAANLEVAPKLVSQRLAQLTNCGDYPVAELLKAIEALLGEQRKGVAA